MYASCKELNMLGSKKEIVKLSPFYVLMGDRLTPAGDLREVILHAQYVEDLYGINAPIFEVDGDNCFIQVSLKDVMKKLEENNKKTK